mmetsp:Transcript_4876/g.8469  ORF Transcript_4876/g.8469 Transcript_4876/m.8469 type:complete len:168 (-) Transcript_4876:391-894(-)|eukprot:CAMPEP_0119102224 /NCGR_PEP_ID=MMETSP1180-20130426/1042_1 /TAXON_ID=3052 ORGANISM="Chlamydomonas cf sp, Strain CCMP681" /NCGR_SAMPLE_ID=MMETSP1180 /ASSEMBLY_ACC=CAM_ASM_000741 /LENGTH=167 /DNA_ID=CAMNT_0007086471 /DNA_START=117 /DNA_END=620 /DNA_ORIENTATION=-
MADALKGMTASGQMTMWRDAMKKEELAAKYHQDEWGFLSAKPEDMRKLSSATVAVKYWDKAGATVLRKRMPELNVVPLAATDENVQLNVEDLISTRSFKTTFAHPMTALESINHSHAKALSDLRSLPDPIYTTTSASYGSRLPLEQFGISAHGVKETEATRLDRRDY